MNVVFFILCVISITVLCIFSPESALPAMLKGANKALTLTFTLVPVYAVWTGLYRILELSGVTNAMSKRLKRPVNLLFGKTGDKAAEYISLNLSANLLGLGGVATPLGIKACAELEIENNHKAAELLLVVAATSVQVLPVSVLALMISYGSKNSSSIILPGFLSTLFSSVCGITLFKLFSKLRDKQSCRECRKTQSKNAVRHEKTQRKQKLNTLAGSKK